MDDKAATVRRTAVGVLGELAEAPIFLVLVNIFNTITTNIPKAEGLTAIEAWVIGCVLFVFGALIGKMRFIVL